MRSPGRLGWMLTVLAALALAGAVLLLGFPFSGRDEPASGSQREAPADSRGPVLQGRADASLSAATTTGTVPDGRTAAFRVLAPDGRAAAGASTTYRAFDRLADWSNGVASADGLVSLVPTVVGQRCQVNVAAGSSWAAQSFDVWAEGEVVLQLPTGCSVWFELPAGDATGLGRVLRFGTAGTDLTKTITEARTLLGRFAGDLHLYALGETPAAPSLNALLLPPSGEITLRWEGRTLARTDPCWLRVRSPAGSQGPPAVTLSESDEFVGGTEVAARRSEADAVLLGVAPGSVTILATSGETWALADVEAKPSDAPVDVPLAWTNGCTLEVLLPVEPSGNVELNVRRMPGRGHEFGGWSESPGMTLGSISFLPEVQEFPTGQWPVPSRRPDPLRRVWEGLPRGAEVHVLVPTQEWGTLQADVTIPLEGDRTVIDIPASTRITVRAVVAGAPDPDMWLQVDSPGRLSGVFARTVGASAVVTGLAPGASITVRMVDALWKGEVAAIVEDGAEIRVPLTRRPTARYRARVVDEAGKPLARVGVSFGRDFDVGTTVLTDEDGWAEAVTASDRIVMASTAHPGLSSGRVSVPDGGEVTVVARRHHSLEVVFDIGDQVVEVVEEASRGESGGGSSSGIRHVFPGSRYEVGLEPGTTRVRLSVRSASAEPAVLFDREIEVGSATTTTLRVTR